LHFATQRISDYFADILDLLALKLSSDNSKSGCFYL